MWPDRAAIGFFGVNRTKEVRKIILATLDTAIQRRFNLGTIQFDDACVAAAVQERNVIAAKFKLPLQRIERNTP